jgi:hypothetical protein
MDPLTVQADPRTVARALNGMKQKRKGAATARKVITSTAKQ